jgi:hypothetical protein
MKIGIELKNNRLIYMISTTHKISYSYLILTGYAYFSVNSHLRVIEDKYSDKLRNSSFYK